MLKDRVRGQYSDPTKIHRIDHVGKRYSVQGPHLPSPSPQRTPLLYQAGSSASGRSFAARNAEATFIIAPSPAIARQQIDETRRLAVEAGRLAEDITFYQGLSFVIGDTEAEAAAKAAEYEQYVSIDGYLAHNALVDKTGRAYDPDTRLVDVQTDTMKGFSEWVRKAVTDHEPTIRDAALVISRSTRIVGTPEQIADRLVEWQDAGVDGINVINWVLPGSFEEFAEKVLPILRQRGLAQTEYAPGTLREKLFGRAHLDERHPAARYRGAFSDKPAAALPVPSGVPA